MKLILLLGFVALASTFSVDTDPIAEDAVADRLEETDNKVEEVDAETSSADRFEAELQKLRNNRRFETTKCVAEVQFLKRKFLSESGSRKNLHNSILAILRRVDKMTKPSLTTSDLTLSGVTDLLMDMEIDLPKDANPQKTEVQKLLAKLSADLNNHDRSQKMAVRNAALGCARKCRVRERTVRKLARKLNLWRSLAKRRYAIALSRSIKGLTRLQDLKGDLAANIAKNATAQVVAMSQLLVKHQEEFVAELQNQVKARNMVFHLAIRKSRRARHAYNRAENTCAKLGSKIYPRGERRSAPRKKVRAKIVSRRPRIGRNGANGKWMRRLMQRVWNKRSRGCRRGAKGSRAGCGRPSRKARRFIRRGRDARLLARAASTKATRRPRESRRARLIGMMKRRALAIAKWLRGFLTNSKRSLYSALRKHAAALRNQRRAARMESKIRAATPHAAYKILSFSSSSGLHLNLDPKTGIATAVRINPGQYPPKYKWDFHKSFIKVIPLLPSAVSSVKKAVQNAVAEEDISENAMKKVVSKAINAAAQRSPKAPTPAARPSAPLAVRAAVGDAHAAETCGKIKSWMDRYPQVLRELKRWYAKRQAALQQWYKQHGNMARYNKYAKALKRVFLHRRSHLKAIAKVMFHVEMKVRLQRKIAKVQRQIRAVQAALREAKRQRDAAIRRKAKVSYPVQRCPKGFARDVKTGKCVQSKVQDPKDPQECGKNMVFINDACQCRRGFHLSESRRGKTVCIANSRIARPLSRVCKKGFFYYRHRCVKTCPAPRVAVKNTRRCELPAAAAVDSKRPNCGKNMIFKNGKCSCLAGHRRARGGDFCIRYSSKFFECRPGWFLNGKNCVRTCPKGLTADSANRVCSDKTGILKKELKLEDAKKKAAEDAAKERLRKRQLLRAQLKRLMDLHRHALEAARKAAAALKKANADADALAQKHTRDAAEAARHKKLLEDARRRVADLAAQKTRADLLYKRLKDAHKNAVDALNTQLKRHNEAEKKAKETAAALLRARLRAKKLADAYRLAQKEADSKAGKAAGLRTALANDELAHARRAARRKARSLRNKERVVLNKAAAKAKKLAAAQRAAKRVELKLKQKEKAMKQKEKKLAAERKWQIKKARAKAALLDSRAAAALNKCKQKRAMLKKARDEARAAAARKAAALARAKERARLQAEALARANAEAARRAAALEKARKLYLSKVNAARACYAIRCQCNTERCVANRKMKMPSLPTPPPIPTLAQVKAVLMSAYRRVRHLKSIRSRLTAAKNAAVKAKKSAAVVAKASNARALVVGRIRKVRRFARKVLRRGLASKETRTWLQNNRGVVASTFGRRSSIVAEITPKPAPKAPSQLPSLRAANSKLNAAKKALFARLRQAKNEAERNALKAQIRKVRQEQIAVLNKIQAEGRK